MHTDEINIIKNRILQYPNCKFLQIGTAWGTTLFSVYPVLKKINGTAISVDLQDPPTEKGSKEPAARIGHVQMILDGGEYSDVIVEYYLSGSDEFFKQNKEKFDVIFVDGDHSYEVGGRDLKNSLNCLSEGGTILLHDIKERTQGLPRDQNVSRAYDEFNLEGWIKKLHKTEHSLAELFHKENRNKRIIT